MKNKKDYVIGLDIGNTSIGYACLDLNNKLLRYKNQHMWGARLFTEPKYEADRAYYRGLRRTYERRRDRIKLLNDFFYEEISKIDSNFFMRLKESFRVSDKIDTVTGKSNMYILFDGDITDKDYYKEYPTIYHLRKALISDKKKFDIRLIYLAIHHIYKYRGNFLYDGEINSDNTLENSLKELFDEFKTEDNTLLNLDIKNFINVLNDKTIPGYINYSKNGQLIMTKDELLAQSYNDIRSKNIIKNVVKALLGYKFDLGQLFNISMPSKEKINFEDYSNNLDYFNELLGDKINIFEMLQQSYTIFMFSKFIGDEKYISDAMIKRYDKHKKDLKILKELVKIMDQEDLENNNQHNIYKHKMFIDITPGNYVTYIKNSKNNKNESKACSKATKDEFYSFVKDFIACKDDCTEKQYILDEIQKGTFMPRIHDYEKSVLPSQFNLKELKIILQNQMKYYPFIKENYEKLLGIFTFVRPHYVGLLSTTSPRSWSYDKDGNPLYATDQKIYPWNFMELIDKDKIAENFINSRVKHCKYIVNEVVMPKASIIYQAFVTLSALSHIRLYGEKMDLDVRNYLFYNLFCKSKKITKQMMCNKLKLIDKKFKDITTADITGLYNDKIDFSMSTLIDIKKIFGKNYDVNNISIYDEIIKYICVFYDNDIKKEKISSSIKMTKNQLQRLLKLKYTGWGLYSKELLVGIVNNDGFNIMDTLLNTRDANNKCYSFSDIINIRKFGFTSILKEYAITDINEKINHYLKEMQYSSSTKSIIQEAIKLVKEIVKYMGYAPKHIYVESNEPVDMKKSEGSRYEKIVKLYKQVENEPYFDKKLWSELSSFRFNKNELKKDKLYLYFLQLGKCMYSGENININNLLECEIDHIIPRLFVVNDSLDNRVLVKSIENQRKADRLLVDSKIISQRKEMWQFLHKHNFISDIKYMTLVRETFVDDTFNKFISKQFIENCKIIKSTKEVLDIIYGKGCVIGVKSSLVHKFRMEQMTCGYPGFAKIRDLNDMHHAKDAYLTAAIGTFISYKFVSLFVDNYNTLEKSNSYSGKSSNTKYCECWIVENQDKASNWLNDNRDCEYISNIFKTMRNNDCQISKKTSSDTNGLFYNYNMNPKSDSDKMIPLRYVKDKNGNMVQLNTSLYGGYKGEQNGYALLIKCGRIYRRKLIVDNIIVNIPIRIIVQEKNNKNAVQEYLESLYKDPIIIRKINKNELVDYKGQKTYFISSHELQNATQLFVNQKFDLLLYFATNDGPYDEKLSEAYDKIMKSSLPEEFVDEFIDKLNLHYPLYKRYANRIEQFYRSDEEYSYQNLTFEEKLDYISKLLLITKTGGSRIDFNKKYGGGCNMGRLTFNYSVDPDYLTIINTSITGLEKQNIQCNISDCDLY